MSITRLEIIDHRPCRGCEGTGVAHNKEVCFVCSGSGTRGRQVIARPSEGVIVTYQEQDAGRTLKVFLAPVAKEAK